MAHLRGRRQWRTCLHASLTVVEFCSIRTRTWIVIHKVATHWPHAQPHKKQGNRITAQGYLISHQTLMWTLPALSSVLLQGTCLHYLKFWTQHSWYRTLLLPQTNNSTLDKDSLPKLEINKWAIYNTQWGKDKDTYGMGEFSAHLSVSLLPIFPHCDAVSLPARWRSK